jgi:biopolymer transport protein ExbB
MEWLRNVIDYGVIGLLVLVSIVAIAIAIERKRFYRKVDIAVYKDKKELELALMRGLHIIATVGSNAPYLGLLGTVLGIMLTFSTIGRQGLVDTGQIMSGLALALKATAIGLIVAIPAIVVYNLLLHSAKRLVLEWEVRSGRRERV